MKVYRFKDGLYYFENNEKKPISEKDYETLFHKDKEPITGEERKRFFVWDYIRKTMVQNEDLSKNTPLSVSKAIEYLKQYKPKIIKWNLSDPFTGRKSDYEFYVLLEGNEYVAIEYRKPKQYEYADLTKYDHNFDNIFDEAEKRRIK